MTIPAQRETDDTILRDTIRNLRFVAEAWGDVLEAELRGTKRPWAASRMTEAEEMDAAKEARAERRERGYGTGSVPAPVHVDVLSQIIDCETVMRDMRRVTRLRLQARISSLVAVLEDHIHTVSRDEINDLGDLVDDMPASSRSDDFPFSLRWLLEALDYVSDDLTLASLAEGAATLRRIVNAVLTDVTEHRWEALCPGCGTKSLSANPHADEPYVVCVNPACVPGQSLRLPALPMCRWSDWSGRPLWQGIDDLEFLAEEIDAAAMAKQEAAS